MRDFKKLLVWQLGMDIVDKVYEVVTFLPAEERYGLRVQMTKCAVSIPSNIAEGSAKKSERDYVRFCEISLGSAFELETQSLVVQRRNWIESGVIADLLELVRKEQAMLTRFIETIGHD